MFQAKDIACARGDSWLFTGCSFTLAAGQLLQITGPNGSGKTTLLRTLCGLRPAQHGKVLWHGAAPASAQFRQALCNVGHSDGLNPALTVSENLRYHFAMRGQPVDGDELQAALSAMALLPCGDIAVERLSQGQRRRAALLRLRLGKASLWIVDEPLAALDTAAARCFGRWLSGHLAGGGIAVCSTHQGLQPLLNTTVQSLDLGALRPAFAPEEPAWVPLPA